MDDLDPIARNATISSSEFSWGMKLGGVARNATISSSEFSWGMKLGGGTFGAVHLVTRITDGVRFVAKEVSLADPHQAESAMKEVRILESIDHPRIVRLLGSYSEAGRLVIVMEHCDAGDLRAQLLDRRGQLLDEGAVWRYFLQASSPAIGLPRLAELASHASARLRDCCT